MDADVEVLEQPDGGVAAGGGAAVGGELDELEMVGDANRARQVGQEDEACLQGRDEKRLRSVVVGRDLAAELVDANGDLLRVETGVGGAVVGG